jgi:hypothetical protein
MKNIHYLNTIIYLSIIGLYIYQPVLGALGQIGLGIFQIAIAILLSNNIEQDNNLGYKSLKIYWYTILAYIILIISSSILQEINQVILFVIPMIIGFYFVIATFLINKK